MVDMKADVGLKTLNLIPSEQILLRSENALGQGVMDDMQDVDIRKDRWIFSASNNQAYRLRYRETEQTIP